MKWIQIIEDHIDRGQFIEALETVNNLLEESPENVDLLEKKAEIYNIQNNFRASIKTYERALHNLQTKEVSNQKNKFYKIYAIYKKMGEIYLYFLKDYDSAAQTYENALEYFNELGEKLQDEKYEHKIELLEELAKINMERQAYSKAKEYYNKLYKLHEKLGILSGLADDIFHIAQVEYKQTHYSKALKNYMRALKLYKKQKEKGRLAISHYYIGKIYFEENQTKQSLAHLKEAISIFNNMYDTYHSEDIKNNIYYKNAVKLLNRINVG